VAGLPGDFKRLFVFLVRNAVAALGEAAGTITVETELAAGRALLRVADNGPSLPGEVLSALFDPANPGREGTNGLELAACESLARRHLGKLRASERRGGGVVITLELPTASNSRPSNGNRGQAS
jgi:signal transduction histidine kinase